MGIPTVTKDRLIEALRTFDKDRRPRKEWANWEDRETFKYAIEFEGRTYPVKEVVSIAADVSTSTFSGGEEANGYVERLGFTVRAIERRSLQYELQSILLEYPAARQSTTLSAESPIAERFERARKVLAKFASERATGETLVVKASYGKGNWAAVPWIAILDRRETSTTQRGVYVVYLVRADGSGVYLRLGIGVTEVLRELSGKRATAELERRVAALAPYCRMLQQYDFSMGPVETRADGTLGRSYDVAGTAFKFYETGKIPSDDVLLDDLGRLLDVYEAYLRERPKPRAVSAEVTLLEGAAASPICLLGTARDWRAVVPESERLIAEHGSVANWWSFRIKEEAKSLLTVPFYLYLNEGSGTFPIRALVTEYVTSETGAGIRSPWPEVTPLEFRDGSSAGDSISLVFRTWIRITKFERIEPPLVLNDFVPVEELSNKNSLLNQNTFGYAYRADREPHESGDSVLDREWLAKETLLPAQLLEDLSTASLVGGAPTVLAGPPGTSKTHTAVALAKFHTGGDGSRIEITQFHPGYTYEAFWEGLRPTLDARQGVSFVRQDGVLLQVVDRMRRAGHFDDLRFPYFIVIDEFNRANLPKVLGEMLYALEHRAEAVRLQYSGKFIVPRNLRIIGTMNTADRSIRSIDAALRRRLEIFELAPNSEVIQNYYKSHELKFPGLIAGFERLNQKLAAARGRHCTVGHTYFMRPGFSEVDLDQVWARRVFPLIEEYFIDEPELTIEFNRRSFWPDE